MVANASNLNPRQRKTGGSTTVVDITPPSPPRGSDGKARLNTSIRTASTKSSTEYSSSISSYANNYLTGSLFDSERDESTAIEDVISELITQSPSDYNVNKVTYEQKEKVPLNTSQRDDDDNDQEVDHVGLLLGAKSVCSSNYSSNSFIEKIRSLEINEVHFEDVVAKRSKKVMDTYLNAFIDSHDHKSARRRSVQLLHEPPSSISFSAGSNSETSLPEKEETKKEKDDKFSKSMNDIETKPPVVISTTKSSDFEPRNERVKDASHKVDKSQHSRKQSRRKCNQLSHSMNDLDQTNSIKNWYNLVRKDRKNSNKRRPSALTRSMNDVSTNPPPTQHTKTRRQNRRMTVCFSKTDNDDGDMQRTESDQSKIYVKNMPWTDHKGNGGEYSGEVNRLMQPHGRGVLKYNDGTKIKVTWVNGTLIEDRPCASGAIPAIESSKKSRQGRCSSTDSQQPPPLNSKTCLPGFRLGDAASPSDMVIEGDKKKALANIKALKVDDVAFILRSDGSWTYAAVANFYAKRGKISSMRFVVDEMGSMKTVEKEDWAECIRMVNAEAYKSPSSSSHDIDPDSPCSSEEAVKDTLSLDEVKEFFQKIEVRRPRYIQLD